MSATPPLPATRPLPSRWWPVAVGGPLLVALYLAAQLTASGPRDPRMVLVGALAGALVVYAIWIVPPSWSISAALLLSMFGGSWGTLGLPRSVAPDRIVLVVALAAIVVRAPCARDRPLIRFKPLYAVMYVAGAYAIGSAIAVGTITNHGAIFDLLDRMQILQWLVFIIAPAAFVTAADRRVLMGTLVAMGLYLGCTGIFEILGPHALVFPRYINNPNVGIQFGRARGPFVEAAVNGLALYACILASCIALREWRSRLALVLAGLAIAVCSVSLLLTFQRTIWIGVAIAALVTLIVVRELRRYILPALLGVAVIVGIGFTIPSVHQKLQTRTNDVGTVQDREALDAAAVNMVEARPLLGFGWGRFTTVAPSYFVTSNSYSSEGFVGTPVHDVYASIAAELGLVGMVLWLLILIWGVGGAVFTNRAPPELRPWRVALGSLFILWLAAGISSPLATSFQSLILWLWAAVVLGGCGPVFPVTNRDGAADAR